MISLLKVERFYSKLGESYKPGIITRVVLAASEIKEKGEKIISLTGGLYDPVSIPYEKVSAVLEEASAEDWRGMLQYGSTLGSIVLRRELAKFMLGHRVKADPETEVIVTCGSQQAIDLVSRVFIDDGDTVIVGSPTYLQALKAFAQFNPEYKSIPVDAEGMVTDELEKELKKMKREGQTPKLLYTVPSFQNPTGANLTLERRRRMVELAEEHDFLILEDNPYGYISFEGGMPLPLKGLDDTGRVMYTSTLSKILSPGLRVGWLAAYKGFVEKMADAKGRVNVCNDGISQYVASESLIRGDVERQIPKITDVYRRKRDLMLEAMDTSFPKEAEWKDPEGGLFIWVKMPPRLNTTEMLAEALKRGVAYIPGSNFFIHQVHNYLRLNYSYPSQEDIVEGVSILGKLLKGSL